MTRKKILVVDDEPHVARMLDFLFQSRNKNYAIIKADNGQDGFEKATSEKPDLIILDIMMPKEAKDSGKITHDTGLTLLKKLKDDSETKKIPVIMLAVAGSANAEEAERTGAVGSFTKNYDDDEMFECVEAILG